MSFPILISSSNYQSNNLFKISFPNIVDLNDFECSVGEMFLYYSWYNISAALNNNQYQLVIPTNTPQTFTITIPDGAYNISTLNNYLQYWFIANNFYITNNTTNVNTYYAAFAISPSSYQVQLLTTALPTSTPSGYTAASGFSGNWPSSSNQSMQFIISSTNTFNIIIGFNAGTYPPVATISGTTYTASSQLVPNVNPISTVQCRLSCLYNEFSSNSQLLHTFTNQGVSIGNIVNASPNFYQAVPCSGSHKDLYFSLFDSNGNPLGLLDSNVCIKLNFQKKK